MIKDAKNVRHEQDKKGNGMHLEIFPGDRVTASLNQSILTFYCASKR